MVSLNRVLTCTVNLVVSVRAARIGQVSSVGACKELDGAAGESSPSFCQQRIELNIGLCSP